MCPDIHKFQIHDPLHLTQPSTCCESYTYIPLISISTFGSLLVDTRRNIIFSFTSIIILTDSAPNIHRAIFFTSVILYNLYLFLLM